MGASISDLLNEAAQVVGVAPPKSAQQAAEAWGGIDTTRVDVGRLAAKIRAAQEPIPVRDARPIYCMKDAHDCYVRVLAWDPFRDLIVSGGGDGRIRLWGTTRYESAGELDAKLSVRALLILTEELASGHSNGHVIIWGMEKSGRPIVQTLKEHREAVYALAMLKSGTLVTGAEDIRVFTRSWRGFVCVQTISEEVLCMCNVPKSGQVVTGDMNSLVTVWDARKDEKWKVAAECRGHDRSVWCVCYVHDVSRCVTGGADQTIRVWDPDSWTCKHVIKDNFGWVVGLSCGPGWLLSCSNDQTVRVYDMQTWLCERTFDESEYEVYCVLAFGGGRFAAGGAEMSIMVYGGTEYKMSPEMANLKTNALKAASGPEKSDTRKNRANLLMSSYDDTAGSREAYVPERRPVPVRVVEPMEQSVMDWGAAMNSARAPAQNSWNAKAKVEEVALDSAPNFGRKELDDSSDLLFDTCKAAPRLDTESNRGWSLQCTNGAVPCTLKVESTVKEFRVGRTVQELELWNRLVPDDALRNTISREHFRLRVDRTKLTLHNLSGGGTSVNGTVVNETLLRIGDVIGIGNQNPVNGGEMRPVLLFKVC